MRVGVLREIKTDEHRVALPLLAPMSEVAGRLVIGTVLAAAATGNSYFPPESLLPFDYA